MRKELLTWQWSGYPRYHCYRTNLIIHILTVPLFVCGAGAVLATPVIGWRGLAGLAGMAVAVVAQGRGHRLEQNPPEPFLGPGDVVARLLAEQFITFWRFVAGGGFARALRGSSPPQESDPGDRP